MTSWWEPADTVQGNLLSDDPYAYVAGNPETLSDPTGQLIVASCYSQGCGIYAIPHLSTSLESLTSFPGLSIGSTGTSNGVAGTNHTSSQTSDPNGPACGIGCRSNIFVDNGSHLVPVTSASTAPGCVSVGGFGSLACVSTGGVGGTSFIRVNLPPSTFNYCPPPVGCGGDGNPSDGENTNNKDNIAFANESLGNAGADSEPQNISSEGAQAGQAAEPVTDPTNTTPIDLYRSGNSTGPRLDNVRPGKEFNTGPNGEEILYPDQTPRPNGLSTFENQGVGKNWWKLPAGSPVPDGLRFFNDHGDHWTIEPLWPMGKDEYIGFVQQTLEYWIGPLPAI